jgi:hypothetical protein
MRRVVCFVGGALLALCLVGCTDDEFTSGPGGEDKDSDGWTADVDCDDKDPDVNPAAQEKVNCVDDNCNGDVDEGTSNHDKDKDGYCPSNGDCDEGNPMRHPAMAEDGGDGSGKPNGIDDNCNGVIDDGLPGSDADQDGFSADDGDCNDKDPFINPGAIEVVGMTCDSAEDCPNNKCFGGYCRCTADTDCASGSTCTQDTDCKLAGETCKSGKCITTFKCHPAVSGMSDPTLNVCRDDTDNDCDGKKDEMPETCDKPSALNKGNPLDYARAIELCDTDRACGLESKCPGNLKCVNSKCTRVLSASFNAKSKQEQRDIAVDFAKGGPFKPRMGESFVVLSTGVASYDPKSNTTCPQDGTDYMFKETDPDVTAKDKDANDMMELVLEIAVPTNAQSFAFDFQFFSTEYPEYVGSQFNDTFWVHLESKKLPPGNISFDKNGTPIRINNAFFSVSQPFPGAPQTQQMCTKPWTLLAGTGYGQNECKKGLAGNFSVPNGGSTDWLHTTAPVTPGETIKLRFTIFDKGDGILDSAVLIDNFRWKLNPASKPLTGPD